MTIVEAIKRAQRAAPVDVLGLAKDLGVRVNTTWLDEAVSGELVKSGPNTYEINVNALSPLTRQRFTIAHELGHYIYHRDLIGEGLDDDRAYRSTDVGRFFNTRIGPVQETQANRFAANLLMPHDMIQDMREQGMTRAQIATAMQVSEHALAIRLGEPYP